MKFLDPACEVMPIYFRPFAFADGQKKWCRLVVKCLTILALNSSLFFVSTLAAQTRFLWPESRIDVSQYNYVEACLAAIYRVTDSVESMSGVFSDTSIRRDGEDREPLHPSIVSTAQRCAAQWPVIEIMPNDTIFDSFVRLYLYANRDADAQTLISRYLAEGSSEPESIRINMMGHAALIYRLMHPIRVSALYDLLDGMERTSMSLASWRQLEVQYGQLDFARQQGDSVRAKEYAHRMVALSQKLTPEERNDVAFRKVAPFVASALDLLAQDALDDSLRHSTAAYAALRRANLQKVDAEEWSANKVIGKHAPALEGDFWFSSSEREISTGTGSIVGPSESLRSAHPMPGKISLIVFLDHECRGPTHPLSTPRKCWQEYAILRRIHEQFQDLDIAIVDQTRGFIGEFAPPPPEREAEMLRQWWLGFHRIPGTLVVAKTSFWNLPEPDRRRINNPVSNESNYSFDGTFQRRRVHVFLVDQEGIVVKVWQLDRDKEAEWVRLIKLLKQRIPLGSAAL